MLIKNSKEKMETLTQEIENKSNENEQLWEEIGEREEFIMNTSILSMTNDLEKIKNENEELWDNFFEKEADRQSLQENTDVLSKQKLELHKKVSKFNKKFEKKGKILIRQQTKIEIDNFESEKNDLIAQINNLENINDFLEGDTIKTFENGRYTNEVRECCMQLITEGNVSLNKIPIVINSVLKNLSGKLPERLPSKSLLSSRLMVEAK